MTAKYVGLANSSMSEGLAETFCLTDPSRLENPIIFASEGMYCFGCVVVPRKDILGKSE